MNRFYRLMSPAVAFSTVGTMLMFIAPLPTFRLYGGLATAGAYTMLIQVVLTSLLVVGIDDLHSQKCVWSGSLLEAADTSYGLRRALVHLYLWRFTPALLLAFGLAESTATVAIGLLDRPAASGRYLELLGADVQGSELLMAILLAAIAICMFPKGVLAYCGWCLGFAAGSALAQVVLGPQEPVSAISVVWLGGAALLCAIRSAPLLLSAVGSAIGLEPRRFVRPL
jgi:hypothetical protein